MVQVWPSDLDVLLSALAKNKKDNETFLLTARLDDETRKSVEHLVETQQAIWNRYRDKTRHQSRRPRGGIK